MDNFSVLKKKISGFLFKRVTIVQICKCVHFAGFRYGHNEYNPYETYIIELHNGIDEKERKEKFIQFLRYYRPNTFGEALGIKLSKDYALWQYPWEFKINPEFNGHDMNVHLIPDIITHFSSAGIPHNMVDQEFAALDAAYYSISHRGYLPEKFGYAELLQLHNDSNGTNAYILRDGNHRISALSALGYKEFSAHQHKRDLVYRSEVMKWNGVKQGYFTPEDALKIFDLYFTGNKSYKLTNIPAKLV